MPKNCSIAASFPTFHRADLSSLYYGLVLQYSTVQYDATKCDIVTAR